MIVNHSDSLQSLSSIIHQALLRTLIKCANVCDKFPNGIVYRSHGFPFLIITWSCLTTCTEQTTETSGTTEGCFTGILIDGETDSATLESIYTGQYSEFHRSSECPTNKLTQPSYFSWLVDIQPAITWHPTGSISSCHDSAENLTPAARPCGRTLAPILVEATGDMNEAMVNLILVEATGDMKPWWTWGSLNRLFAMCT